MIRWGGAAKNVAGTAEDVPASYPSPSACGLLHSTYQSHLVTQAKTKKQSRGGGEKTQQQPWRCLGMSFRSFAHPFIHCQVLSWRWWWLLLLLFLQEHCTNYKWGLIDRRYCQCNYNRTPSHTHIIIITIISCFPSSSRLNVRLSAATIQQHRPMSKWTLCYLSASYYLHTIRGVFSCLLFTIYSARASCQ